MKLKEKLHTLSLRVRLTILVSAELVVAVLIALGIDSLFNNIIFKSFEIPLFVDLLVISLIIGIFVTWFMSRLFFDPIKKLGRAMEQVSKGDFGVRIKTNTSAPEIREVFKGFNLMAGELEATEILQSDFASNVSHEFKTPLNAIEGYSTLLQEGDNLSATQKEYLEKILFNTNRLSSLVGSILLLSKIENQSILPVASTYRLDEQVRQSLLSLEPMWEEKNTEFDVELEEIEYTGNENMLYHVWDNLIGNAVKFAPRMGKVTLRLFKDSRGIVFTVSDNGPGIDEKSLNHIFDKFYQADHSRRSDGVGLGLALAKRILSLSSGEIFAENLTRGCRFTVILK